MASVDRTEQDELLQSAFAEHRERLLRFAERHLNPVLRRRVSPEDVLQEAAENVCRWGGAFVNNPDLPGHESVIVLNPNKEDAQVTLTLYFTDRDPIDLPAFEVKAGDGKLDNEYSFLAVDQKNVIIETAKKAYDDESMIFRAYECVNKRTAATFTPGFEVKKAYLCDMLENELSELPVIDGKIKMTLGNYEIVTVKLIKA